MLYQLVQEEILWACDKLRFQVLKMESMKMAVSIIKVIAQQAPLKW